MEDSLKRIGEKVGCSVRVSPHVGRHTFATLALSKGMPLETLQKVLGHKTIISTQVYAELINPKIGEDTDRMREKIGGMFRLANEEEGMLIRQMEKRKDSRPYFGVVYSFISYTQSRAIVPGESG